MAISHRPVDNALHPAWRDAAVHLISSMLWDDTLLEDEAEKAIASMTNGTGYALRQLAPDSGVYCNKVWLLLLSILYTYMFIIGINTNPNKRPTSGSPTGSGLSRGLTIPERGLLSRRMTRIVCCGVTLVWAVSYLSTRKTVLSVLRSKALAMGPGRVIQCVLVKQISRIAALFRTLINYL